MSWWQAVRICTIYSDDGNWILMMETAVTSHDRQSPQKGPSGWRSPIPCGALPGRASNWIGWTRARHSYSDRPRFSFYLFSYYDATRACVCLAPATGRASQID